jgi:hypothetical protein
MKVVITQSMLFPWIGMLEQIRLADIFVHYDDVQFSKGSFTNRVQVKTREGVRWMTIPLQNFSIGTSIDSVCIDESVAWRDRHLAMLSQSFKGAPYALEALNIVEDVYSKSCSTIGEISRASMIAIANYYGLLDKKKILDVRDLNVVGSSSERVLHIMAEVGGDTYITGHGGLNYLAHNLFDLAGVAVCYMHYESKPYAQLWGEFTPYVTGLDLIANCGPCGAEKICSNAVPWRKFVNSRN